MRVRLPGSGLHVLMAYVIQAVRDVARDGVAKKVRILGDDPYLPPEPGCVYFPQIDSFDGHLKSKRSTKNTLDVPNDRSHPENMC